MHPQYDLDHIREKLECDKENPVHLRLGDNDSTFDGPIRGGVPSGVNLPGPRKSVDAGGPYSYHEQKFRYQEPVQLEKELNQMVKDVQGNCGQLMFLINEIRPLHNQAVGMAK